jgi:hypothetical protein
MDRAKEHAEELNRTIQAFYKTNPYEIAHEFETGYAKPTLPSVDPAKGIHVYNVVTRHPIPDRIAILAGEIVQAMRSALDYVAWQLALARSDTPPPTTAFPIFANRTLYDRDKARFIGGIDAAIHPVFDSVQPYHARDKATEHPLWVLHRLANDDKHRVPHVVGSLPSGIMFERPAGVDLATTMTVGPFKDHDEVATLAIISGADPETQLNPKFTIAVAFGTDTPARGRHLTNEIDRIGREVDITIRKFEAFFP